jgi:hypothetical protein
MNPVSFPTQGEVVQFTFDALGVLPRKHDDDASFDETQKKSTQKALQRLALEEGTLSQQRLGEMIQTLSYLVAGSIQPRECFALSDILLDLFDIYLNTLRDEGTFLTKAETARYFLLSSVALRLPMSVAKHIQRYNVAADGLVVPDEIYWYLPSKDANGWTFPLEKVMRWAYEVAGVSIQKFHWPDCADPTTNEKNLQSAKKWLTDRHLPSWPALLKNFNQSFDALSRMREKQGLPVLSDTKKNSIRTALFIARASTYISKSIVSHHGDAALEEFCSRYLISADCVNDDIHKIRDYVQKFIAHHDIPSTKWDSVWFYISTDYWVQFADQHYSVIQALKRQQITMAEAVEIARKIGRFAALPLEKPEKFSSQHSTPQGFIEAFLDGLELSKSTDFSIEKIKKYEKHLDSCGLSHVLPWMAPWQHAIYYYRAEQYEKAYPFIKDAFEKARYCAGNKQYTLLNQYIELAAKNDKWQDFKKGIEWATYLGFEVRWLRKDEQTEEKLKFVFYMMQRARYAV